MIDSSLKLLKTLSLTILQQVSTKNEFNKIEYNNIDFVSKNLIEEELVIYRERKRRNVIIIGLGSIYFLLVLVLLV